MTENNKKSFRSILLLDEMISHDRQFGTVAKGNDKVLDPFFAELKAKGYVTVSGANYAPTAKGRDAHSLFNKRFQEFLRLYDIFGFVDLTAGEFAFSRFFDFDEDEEWLDYAEDDRFEDVRIAVAIAKKIDPAEIVFMAFINENRFDTENDGWQKDLASDEIWKEIEAICETAIKPGQLGNPDVIEDIMQQGSAILRDLLHKELERQKEENENGSEEEVIEEYETVTYYEPYYADPWYVSPIWLLPLFIW